MGLLLTLHLSQVSIKHQINVNLGYPYNEE